MKLRALLKRDAKMFKRGFISALVLAALFFALCAAAALSLSRGAERDGTVKIMLVDEDGSTASRLAVNLVRNQDFIGTAMEIHTAKRAEAMDALQDGQCAAVIFLPEGYLGAILSGRECRGEIILSPAAALNSDVVESIAHAGEILLAAGQYGVFCGETLIRENELFDIYDDYLTKTNLRLLNEATGAYHNYFEIHSLSYADTGMSLAAHYAAGWLCLLCSLAAMFFHRLLLTDLSLLPRLRSAGVGDGQFMCFKLLLPWLFRCLIIATAAAALSYLGLGARFDLLSILCALLAAAFITLWESGLILAFGSSAGAVSTLLAFSGLFLTGGILPRTMLPKALLLLGDISPLGAARGLLATLLGGPFEVLPFLAAAVYSAIALFLMHRRLAAAVKGGETA